MTPSSLWKDNILYQPESLIEVYKNKLISLAMLEHAKNHKNNSVGATGGRDSEETKKHFAERFLTSSARTQFVVIDPRENFKAVSNNLKSTFSSGKISILDIPAGTGAGILSLLTSLAELRVHSILPKLPLHVHIVGGDFSTSALVIYSQLLQDIKDLLEQHLIFIEHETCEWDATSPQSTNLLVRQFLRHEHNYEEHYVLMSAFSGVGSSNYKKFDTSFNYIQTALSHLNTTILYIEPNMKEANAFLKFIDKLHSQLTTWLSTVINLSIQPDARFQWHDPITGNTPKSAIILKQYSRE
jgi:hypothetical protein